MLLNDNNSGLSERVKKKHLKELSEYRVGTLRPNPDLHSLFLEVTQDCNEHCRHCGSRCGDLKNDEPVTLEEWKRVLSEVKRDFDISKIRLCITGGEPLLYKDFFELVNFADSLGFKWGMTSNGTLITREIAGRLRAANMKTVSVSVDGLRESHEWFRQSPGSFDKTIEGIKNLLEENFFKHVQVTTVVHHENFHELDDMYIFFSKLGIRSWRVINIEPIGRAKDNPELMLSEDELRGLIYFIEDHRFKNKMEVLYGCSHYLGTEHEREVRPWYFLCNAGVYTASIQNNGNISACLDIERRRELIEGNIRKDNLKRVWEEGFKIYRSDFRKEGKCKDCSEYPYCAGDSFHTWNFDKMEPELCMYEVMKNWRI